MFVQLHPVISVLKLISQVKRVNDIEMSCSGPFCCIAADAAVLAVPVLKAARDGACTTSGQPIPVFHRDTVQ